MKKTLKLIPALAMLLVSAVLVSTTTYAWFSMNNKVTVTGMTVKTKVSSNLLISADTTESNFTTAIEQSRSALLEPASTTDGKYFLYTVNAKADGSKASGTYTVYSEATALTPADTSADKTNYDADFNSKYAIATANSGGVAFNTAYAYVDYDFYLKATSTDDGQKVAMNFCNLKYDGGAITDKAFRVAVFATDGQDTAVLAEGETQSLKAIISPSGAVYQTPNSAVTSAGIVDTVSNLGTAVVIDTLNTGNVRYYKVTVRLWLEGEDTTCTNSTFVSLTRDYTLNLSFILSSDNGITEIKSVTQEATASKTDLTATVTLNTSETVASRQWYTANDDNAIAGQTNATYTGSNGQEVYCIVTTLSGQMYKTNNVTLTAAP